MLVNHQSALDPAPVPAQRFRLNNWAIGLVLIAGVAGAAMASGGVRARLFGPSPAPVLMQGATPQVAQGGPFANSFADVLRPALPAVVSIHTSRIVRPSANMSPFQNDPRFREFFGDQFGNMQPSPQREQGLGSGVIISADGTIITNNHVVEGAAEIRVELLDRRDFRARLVGTDPQSDIAVLKIETSGLPTIPIGDASRMRVGDIVLAIGNPFGIGETATMGIVSATGRGLGGRIEQYEDFIQTDAAINPGNSGGALIDMQGRLVGINTAILPGMGGGNQGIGFAIPINLAQGVMQQLVTRGKVVRGYLGLIPQDVTPDLAAQFGLKSQMGALVASIDASTPAGRAGVQRGDVITRLNGDSVYSANALRLRVSQTAPGTVVTLSIWRANRSQDIRVTLGELPTAAVAARDSVAPGGTGIMRGVEVQELTPAIAQSLQLPKGTTGVAVTAVDPTSPAAAANLSRGMVIQEINRRAVADAAQYRAALAAAGNRSLLLLVMVPNSGGATNYIVISAP